MMEQACLPTFTTSSGANGEASLPDKQEREVCMEFPVN